MKFYGIEMKGRLILQKLDQKPSFDSARDEGRLIYTKNDNNIYVGNDFRWNLVNGIDKVSELPIFDSARDEGRLVYSNNEIYIGSDTKWNLLSGIEEIDTGSVDASTEESKVVYDGGQLYYSDGASWKMIINNDDPRLTDDRDPTSHTHSGGDITSAVNNATNCSRQVIAGTLLSGGGQLNANRTINLMHGGNWQPRRVSHSTSNPSGGSNGDIWLKY